MVTEVVTASAESLALVEPVLVDLALADAKTRRDCIAPSARAQWPKLLEPPNKSTSKVKIKSTDLLMEKP